MSNVNVAELHRRCLAAALSLALPSGCRERERWPMPTQAAKETRSREPECRTFEDCPELAAPCPSSLTIASAAVPTEARFDERRTSEVRGRFDNEARSRQVCCYSWSEGCHGRPLLLQDGTALQAADVERSDWHWELELTLDAGEHAGEVASRWLDIGRAEHASIASFLRTSLGLLAQGAPSELVQAQLRGAEDEVRHACIAFGIARHFGAARGPGPLDLASLPPLATTDELALDTLVGGCVGETVAAALALESAARGAAELAPWLERIADDEGHHAALAWRTLGWLFERSHDRDNLAEAIRRATARVSESRPARGASSYEAFGLLDASTSAEIRRAALAAIVSPCAEALLSRS